MLLIVGVVIVLAAVVIIPRMRMPGGANAAAAGAGVGRLEGPHRQTADNALDSARMDDDGALQSLDPSTERLAGTR